MWQAVKFMPEEVEPDRPTELFQFNFNLMCAEIIQEAEGMWVAVLLDTDGDETWVSDGVGSVYEAKVLVSEQVRECFAGWLNEMGRELP